MEKNKFKTDLKDKFTACCYIQEAIAEEIDLKAIISVVDDITDEHPDDRDFSTIAQIMQLFQANLKDMNGFIEDVKRGINGEGTGGTVEEDTTFSPEESEEQPDPTC